MPNLAISLHATTEEQRAAIVPPSHEIRAARHHRGLPALPARQTQPDHLRVRHAERRERHAGRRAPAGPPARRREGQGQPDPAQCRPGHPVRAAGRIGTVDAFARILARDRASPSRCARAAAATSAPPAGSSSSRAAARPARRRRWRRCSDDAAAGESRARALAARASAAHRRRLRRRAAEPEGAAQAGRRHGRPGGQERGHRTLHRRPRRHADRRAERAARLLRPGRRRQDAAHRRRLQQLGDDAAGLRRQGRHADPHRRHDRGRTSRAPRSPTRGSSTCCSSRRRPGPIRRTRARCGRSPGPGPKCGCRSGPCPPRWKARPRSPRARSLQEAFDSRALKGTAPRLDLPAGRLRGVAGRSTRRSTSSTAATTPTGCRCRRCSISSSRRRPSRRSSRVFVEPGSRQEEYSRNPAWRTFMARELVPAIDKRHPHVRGARPSRDLRQLPGRLRRRRPGGRESRTCSGCARRSPRRRRRRRC